MLQPAIFHPKALLAIRSFPKAARRGLGEAILDLQQGQRLGMPLSRPMPARDIQLGKKRFAEVLYE
jgi:hypothetical protein